VLLLVDAPHRFAPGRVHRAVTDIARQWCRLPRWCAAAYDDDTAVLSGKNNRPSECVTNLLPSLQGGLQNPPRLRCREQFFARRHYRKSSVQTAAHLARLATFSGEIHV
jgi:hypothetical protein